MPNFDKHKAQFLGRVLERIRSAVYTVAGDLAVEVFVTPEPLPFSERSTGHRIDLKVGDVWAKAVFDCGWFHFTGAVPDDLAGKDVVLLIDVNGEACIVDESGTPWIGLTNINSEFDKVLGMPGKRVVPLVNPARGGETIDLWADAGANDLFGRMQDSGTLEQACIAVRNPELFALQWDWEVLHELMVHLPEQSARRARLWDALCRASNHLIEFSEPEAASARAILSPELKKNGGDASLIISAVGHAHMDLAWLWPIRETIRKCGRTFATVLRMMERYPDYIFGASQPQQYQWVKDQYPALYAQVKQRVAEGRWEPQGAMWVEPDTNVPSGESLVRQILYGLKFFAEEFGATPTILWEPDVFGYSGALPQILLKSGIDCFMTQKLSWNQVTKHPHHTFWWQGIDGSRVLAHLPPEDTYNGPAAPRSLLKLEHEYLDKNVSDRALMLFGIGDGGGGPGEEHLERLSREHDLAGLCPVIQEPAEKFFDRLREGSDRYATWSGELYLEKHQGTFTSQARNKRFNRKLELALRELELAATIAGQFIAADYQFPKAAVDAIWRELLLYQFHDILPGSSIQRVYDESLARYARLAEQVAALTAQAESAYISSLSSRSLLIPAEAQPSTAIINSLSWERTHWLKICSQWQRVIVPAMGLSIVSTVSTANAEPAAYEIAGSVRHLENKYLRVEFGEDGTITSCYDKTAKRQTLAARGNVLAVYEDPGDAWDFSMDYRERQCGKFQLESSDYLTDGPKSIIRTKYSYGTSTLAQDVVLTSGSRILEFTTNVDWKESGKMLRTSFPTTILASEATCDIQFGSIRRPTHRNTLRDVAMMEICAHKFVDLSDRGYGVAVLNDCKYGHAVIGGTIDLNLLRSPSYPDPTADRAVHEFVYALFPHVGDHIAGGVVQAGYELNVPLRVCNAADGTMARRSWLSIDAPNIIIETVKPSEDGTGWVVRLYDSAGASTDTLLTLPPGTGEVFRVNMIEQQPQPMTIAENKVSLHFGPFEVHTLLVQHV
jgi:alpha-mannosidase